MTDRTIRNLAHLRRSASTARVLNLLRVWLDHGHEPEWAERPVFQTMALNRSLIMKHRLRRDEVDSFYLRRQVATKVIIPLDSRDLKAGGVTSSSVSATMSGSCGRCSAFPPVIRT